MTLTLVHIEVIDSKPKRVEQLLNAPLPFVQFCLDNNGWPEVVLLDSTFYCLTTWSGKESAEYEKTHGFDLNACKQSIASSGQPISPASDVTDVVPALPQSAT